uniref:Uncharacterized protein n=1 Tax=Anguilla anguilla TaxID=7936 RepID=A0A0E9P6W2_ANGAN
MLGDTRCNMNRGVHTCLNKVVKFC